MNNVERDIGSILARLDIMTAQRQEDLERSSRERQEILTAFKEMDAKVDDLAEALAQHSSGPSRAEIDAIKTRLHEVYLPVKGDENQLGFESRIAAIEKMELKRQGLRGLINWIAVPLSGILGAIAAKKFGS